MEIVYDLEICAELQVANVTALDAVPSAGDIDEGRPGQLLQFIWRQPKNRIWCTRGSPDLRVTLQVLIEIGDGRGAVTDRGDTANGKSRFLTNERCIRSHQGFAEQRGDLAFIGAVAAAGHHQNRSITLGGTKDQGLGDLLDLATDCPRGLLGCSRAFGKAFDDEFETAAFQSLLNPKSTPLQGFSAQEASSLLRRVAAAMARVMSGCSASSAISTFRASKVVPPGEVTFSRSCDAGSLD